MWIYDTAEQSKSSLPQMGRVQLPIAPGTQSYTIPGTDWWSSDSTVDWPNLRGQQKTIHFAAGLVNRIGSQHCQELERGDHR